MAEAGGLERFRRGQLLSLSGAFPVGAGGLAAEARQRLDRVQAGGFRRDERFGGGTSDAQSKVTIPGSPEKQEEYYRFLFRRAQEHRFEFIVSFIHRDYDPLWEAIKSSAPEIFKAWRDCGMVDEHGKDRPVLALWDDWLSRWWKR